MSGCAHLQEQCKLKIPRSYQVPDRYAIGDVELEAAKLLISK